MHIPKPEIIDPQSVPSLRWGVIGPGNIAQAFVRTCLKNTKQRFVAVGSRNPERAREFAKTFEMEIIFDNYVSLVESSSVDAIYIASWQVDHFEHAMLALNAGKHVLIEKPITYLPEQAEQIFSLAKEKGLLAMEAMWTRYLPQSTVIRKLLAEGELGKPELFRASFCVDNRHIPRLWQKGGGGIIYDMGIYPIAMAQQFMGNPTEISAVGQVNSEGLDLESHTVMKYVGGGRSQISASGIATLPTTASCSFEKGVVLIDEPFLVPSGVRIRDKELYFKEQSWSDQSAIQGHDGLCYQATWFAHYVDKGMTASEVHGAKDTVAGIAIAQEISKQIGARAY